MDTPPENKKTKILIVLAASISTSLIFVVPWFLNHMRYEEYFAKEHSHSENSYKRIVSLEAKKTYASDLFERSLYEGEKEKEYIKMKKSGAMISCVERYRNGNHPFALALTACKIELFYDKSNKLPPFDENQ
jgi:hypothetical protein